MRELGRGRKIRKRRVGQRKERREGEMCLEIHKEFMVSKMKARRDGETEGYSEAVAEALLLY